MHDDNDTQAADERADPLHARGYSFDEDDEEETRSYVRGYN